MAGETFTVRYVFKLDGENRKVFDLVIDARTIELTSPRPEQLPPWTRLEFYQCTNCPLSVTTHPRCPLAVNLVNIVTGFDNILSYHAMEIEVTTEERVISQQTTAYRAISSLMGLMIAASGCPHTVFFKPMARFHLPLASERETLYRATSMYLLAQYFAKKEGQPADLELQGLKNIYRNVELINIAIADRLRAAAKTDSSINAIILLDIYAKTIPDVIEESLDEIRYLFAPYSRASSRCSGPAPNRKPGG